MGLHDQIVGLMIFFSILCTVSVGLRLFVRIKLCKGAFGWDDIALVLTWVGLMLWVGFAWKTIDVPYHSEDFYTFVDPKDYICYVMSGLVKISVALVLYRLDHRLSIRMILIADMVVCAIWTIAVTLIISLGCKSRSPFHMSIRTCQDTDYAQEASYVFFNVLHVLIPTYIVWGVQIKGNLKWAVITLFSLGLLAAIAALMKLMVYIEYYNPGAQTNTHVLWYQSMIWAVTEHGLSLFAASVLAIRPFFTYVSNNYTKLPSYGSGTRIKSVSTTTSGRSRASRVSSGKMGGGWPASPGLTVSMELGRIDVRNDVDVHSEYDLEQNLRDPVYRVDAYGDLDGENARVLMKSGSQVHLKPARSADAP